MLKRNNLIIAGLLVVFMATGFFREFVFLNWNEQMRVTYYSSPESYVHPAMTWLSGMSYTGLYWLKWPLTLAFSILFGGLAVAIINRIFREKTYNRITVYVYAGVFLAALLFFAIGWLSGAQTACYSVARFLAGIIETPAMLIILIASFLVHRRL